MLNRQNTEELMICLTNEGLGGVVEDIVTGLLKKSLKDCSVDIGLNKILLKEEDGKIRLEADLSAEMTKEDLIKLIRNKFTKCAE